MTALLFCTDQNDLIPKHFDLELEVSTWLHIRSLEKGRVTRNNLITVLVLLY